MGTALLERPETTTGSCGSRTHWELCCYPGEAACGTTGATWATDVEQLTCPDCRAALVVATLLHLSCGDLLLVVRSDH